MNITTIATVLGMTRFQADNGEQYASVFTVESDSVSDNSKLGVIATTNKCDYNLMDSCRDFTFPAEFTIQGKMVAGAKKVNTLHITSLKPTGQKVPLSATPKT